MVSLQARMISIPLYVGYHLLVFLEISPLGHHSWNQLTALWYFNFSLLSTDSTLNVRRRVIEHDIGLGLPFGDCQLLVRHFGWLCKTFISDVRLLLLVFSFFILLDATSPDFSRYAIWVILFWPFFLLGMQDNVERLLIRDLINKMLLLVVHRVNRRLIRYGRLLLSIFECPFIWVVERKVGASPKGARLRKGLLEVLSPVWDYKGIGIADRSDIAPEIISWH